MQARELSWSAESGICLHALAGRVDWHGVSSGPGDGREVRWAVHAGARAFSALLRGICHGLFWSCNPLFVMVAPGLHHARE
eukprot:8945798-Alexandrium_andersonii.AAC.1